MTCRRGLLILVVVALSGCARREVSPRTIGIEVPEAWTGGELGPAPPADDWWVYFGDDGLDRAIREALESSYDLRAADARIRAAESDAVIAGAELAPEATLALSRSQQRQNFIGFPIPGSTGDQVLSTTSTNYGLRLNASWEPDLWRRIRSGELAAVTNARIRYADFAGARLSLTGQVARAWFAAVEAENQVTLAQVSLESFRVSAERVRARFEAGLRPPLDVRLALAEVAQAEAVLAQRIEQQDRARRQLETLVGRYPAGDSTQAVELPLVPGQVPGGLPSELVYRRPDLVASELAVVVADARVSESKADLRPRFSLTAGTGTSSRNLVGLVDNDLFVWSFVSNLVTPLFNNGRLRAAVDRNSSLAEEALAAYEGQVLNSYREVESALAAEAVLAERERALGDAVSQSVAAREQAEERYRLGLTDIITVLSAQRSAFNAESQLLTVRRNRLDNRVDLHLALGGGFDASDIPGPPTTVRFGGNTD
jgi:outer membrane protein, multidrug efflux system